MDGTYLSSLDAADGLHEEWQLFQAFEHGRQGLGWLLWESPGPAVVVGRHAPIPDQVRQAACEADGVPVLRRCSGGGAVVLGPGCLNYAVGASLDRYPEWLDVASSFAAILGRIASGLQVPGLAVTGVTDIALLDRKVSGNAQRRGRLGLLHHGTLLYGFDPEMATRYLGEPKRQPSYRAGRSHAEFLGNLPCDRSELDTRLRMALRSLSGPVPAQAMVVTASRTNG